MTQDREKAKQIGRDILEAAENYVLEFIRAARAGAGSPALKPHREKLVKAIDAAIDRADQS